MKILLIVDILSIFCGKEDSSYDEHNNKST